MKEKDPTSCQPEQNDREKQLNAILKGESIGPKGTANNGMSLRSIMGGDILAHPFFRRQVKLLILILVYTMIYIGNRYTVQQQQIELAKLEEILIDVKYNALTRSSELTEMSRQSRIEEFIHSHHSELEIATQPPFLIKAPNN